MRICKKCGVEKPLSEFEQYITSSGRRRQRWVCKDCRKRQVRERTREKKKLACPVCGIEKQPFEFVRDNSLDFKAYGKICRECAYKKNLEIRKENLESNYKKKRVFKTPEERRIYIRNKSLQTYRETKKWLIDLKGNKCAVCGKVFPWYAYDFHHEDTKGKESKISRYTKLTKKHLQSLPEFKEEFDKCILVCAICHRRLHLNGGD